MKLWRITIALTILIVFIVGQLLKLGFNDAGLAGLSHINEVYNLDVGLEYMFGKDEEDEERIYESLTEYENDYITAPLSAPIIVVGKPSGNIKQNRLSFGQEIVVEEVLKGEGLIETGESYYVYNPYGFSVDNEGRSVYTNIKNVMEPQNEYLIFLQASELNEYDSVPRSYSLEGSFFDYIKLTQQDSAVISEQLKKVKFMELQQYEYFSTSERILQKVKKIKQDIIRKLAI